MRFRLRTTRKFCVSGDAPLEEVEEGGVVWLREGAMMGGRDVVVLASRRGGSDYLESSSVTPARSFVVVGVDLSDVECAQLSHALQSSFEGVEEAVKRLQFSSVQQVFNSIDERVDRDVNRMGKSVPLAPEKSSMVVQ